MTRYVDENTNFTSGFTIKNDNPCIPGDAGSTVTITKNADGQYVYTVIRTLTGKLSGTYTYDGPVNILGFGAVNISSGIVADGFVIVAPTNDANANCMTQVTVQDGAILKNSTMINSHITVNGGGTSAGNDYISSQVEMAANSSSYSDNFYKPATISGNPGRYELSQGPAYTQFPVSNGYGSFSLGGINASGITVDDLKVYPVGGSSGLSGTAVGAGSEFGNTSMANSTLNTQLSTNGGYTLTNDYKIRTGGTWVASLDTDGVTTIYTNSATKEVITGRVNFIDITSLTIKACAVVDNITVTSTKIASQGGIGSQITRGSTTIYNSGTIQNSFISNSNMVMNANSVSQNNLYVDSGLFVPAGASDNTVLNTVNKGDYFINGGNPVTSNYNLSQDPSLETFISTPTNYNVISVGGKGSIFENSYITGSANPDSDAYYWLNISGTATISCFLTGSLIETVNGPVAVEDICVGDQVVTYQNNQKEIRSVIWTGYNNVIVQQNLVEDKAGYPVRV